MAWTDLVTKSVGEILSAAYVNLIRGNLRYLKGTDGPVTIDNSLTASNVYSGNLIGGTRVGAGTTAPEERLHVQNSAVGTVNVLLDNTANAASAGASILWRGGGSTLNAALLQAYRNGTNLDWLMDISASSNFTTNSAQFVARFKHNGTMGMLGLGMTPTYQLQLANDSAAKPSTSAWTVASDARAKRKIKKWKDGKLKAKGGALAYLRSLPDLVEYEYNGQAGTPDGVAGVGYLAHEMKDKAPEMYSARRGKLKDDDPEETEIGGVNLHYQFIAYRPAIEELEDDNKALRRCVKELEDTLASLASRVDALTPQQPTGA